MKTSTKTKLTVKTAAGIAIIGGAALVAGGFGLRAYNNYMNPSIQPDVQYPQNQEVTAEPVVNGNIAGKNVKDADARCQVQMYDFETTKQFLDNSRSYQKNVTTYPKTDFVCFAKNSSGDTYIGAAQSSAGQKYATPQGVTNTAYNQNGDNNYCCDIKKYYKPMEVANCRYMTEDNLGRSYNSPNECLPFNNKFFCFDPNVSDTIACGGVYQNEPNLKLINKDDCINIFSKFPGSSNMVLSCPISIRSCGFWSQTNNRGRAGFDLCAQNGYAGVCVDKFSGEYVGCKKPGENKCTYINIYSNPRETDINLENNASVCDTGYKASSKKITDAKVVTLGCDYVIIEWTTAEEGGSWVDYGVIGSTDYAKTAIETANVTKHRVRINNLQKNTRYWFDTVSDVAQRPEAGQLSSDKLEFTTSCSEMSCNDIAKTGPFKSAISKCRLYGIRETDASSKPNGICVNKSTGVIVSGGEFGNGSAGCISPMSGSYFCLKQDASGNPTDPNNKVCYFNAAGNYVTESQQ